MAEAAAAALWEVGAAWATDAAIYVASNAAVINAVAAYAVSASYGQHQKKKAAAAGRAAYNASLEDRLVMTATTQAARSRVYGRVRNVDGIVFKATHGTTKEFYTLVIALAGHEVDAIETVYFNETPVTMDGSGYVQEAPWFVSSIQSAGDVVVVSSGSGSVTLAHTPVSGSVKAVFEVDGATAYETTPTVVGNVASITGAPANGTWNVTYQYNSGGSMARVRAYTGAPGQDLSSVLTPLVGGAITSTDKFQGMACLVVTLQYHQDAFPTGVPSISAVMRGAKVFDPRTSTTAWTQNPALIARDWALHANGGGCASGEINAAAFTAAANACDVSTTFTTTAGAETRPLFECGTVIPLDSNPDEALAEICESMAGQWGWAGGLLSVRAGVYRAPVATITEDWITSVEDIAIVSNAPTADAVNVMRPTLADAAQAYTSTPAAEVRSAAYVTADGRELPRELQLGGVTRAVHAQHVCGVLMREAREGLTVQLPCNLRAYQLELFDVVALTLPRFGWSAKAFEVLGWRFSITGGINLTLRETAAAIYTPDATFGVLNLSANTNLATPGQVPQLTGLAATSGSVAQVDGSSIARTAITWTATTSEAVAQSGTVEIQYTPATAAVPTGDWPAAPPASGRATQVDVYGLRIGRFYIVRGRFRNTLGMAGPWSAQLVHLVEGTRAPRIFYQASTPTGDVRDGDQWFDSDDGNRQYARVSGAWVSVRDSGIAQALANAAAAQATADGKIDTYWQTFAPTGASEGDLWFDTTNGYRQSRYTSGAWVAAADTRIGQAISDAADAQATADGKVTTFVQTSAPTAEAPGDLWFDSDDSYRLYRWSGSAWVSVRDAGIGQALSNAAAAQATADGKIATYWDAATPSGAAEGDIWFDTDDAYKQYRYTSGTWVAAADTRIGQAINDAADAQATADGKVVTFVQTTAPTAEAPGDLWFDSDDGYRLHRWSGSAWVSVRDSGIAQAIADAATAQGTADGKVVTFVQTTAPTAEGVGDLWMDSDDGNKLYRWSGSAWVAVRDAGITQALTDASNAQATADGKVVTFVQTTAPTAEGVGDLWMDSDDGNKVYRWNGSSWVALPMGTGGIAPGAATVKATHDLSAQSLLVTSGIAVPDAIELTSATIAKIAGSSVRMTVSGYITLTFKGSGFSSGTKKLLAQAVVTCKDASNALAFTPQPSSLWFREEPIHVELSSVYRIPFAKTAEYVNVTESGSFHISLTLYAAVSTALGTFSAIDAISTATVDCQASIEEVKR